MKLPALLSVFSAPALLAAGLAATVVAVLLIAVSSRVAARRQGAIVAPVLSARGTEGGPRRRLFLRVLVAISALALFTALARPRWGERTESVERRGADVVFVLDTSASMNATDVTPSRFVVARQAAASLLSDLPSDRVALIGLEGEAQTLVPLTLDSVAVGVFLDALAPGIGTRPGTSLAAGIAAAAELLRAGATGGRHVILISDGEDLEGGVDAAVEKARREGVVVHTVFVGGSDGKGAPVPEIDPSGQQTGYKTDASGAPVISKPNAVLLRSIAAKTGGTFSVVSPGRTDLSAVARQIDHSARRPLSATLATNLEERFQIPLAVAVASLGLLLLGLPRPRRSAKTGATALLALVLAGSAGAQQPPAPSTAPATEPAPSPAPESPPLPRIERLLGSPRGEARLGKKALEEKRWDDAATHFRRETELAPTDPIGPYNLGSALSRAGKAEDALSSLQTAEKGGNRDVSADAAYNEGTLLLRSGEYEKAAEAFRQTLKRSPGREDASYNYELCVRKAEEEKKKQQQPQKPSGKEDEQKNRKTGGKSPTPTPSPQGSSGDEKKKEQEKRDHEFESKAKMSREQAEQLLAAIQKADLDEQRRKLAEQKSKRRDVRDW